MAEHNVVREFGIIGFPLSHSRSPQYFHQKFEKENLAWHFYHLFEIDTIFKIHPLIKSHPFLYGLNVTTPHKQTVIPHLHRLDKTAEEIGAVNAIKIVHEGETTELIGYNTDADAFIESLEEAWGLDFRKAMVFGSGGAAAAAHYALEMQGITVTKVSRTTQKGYITYEEITPSMFAEHSLLVNATPVGMLNFPTQQLPISPDNITDKHHLFDMIYNPEKTPFLQLGEEKGAKILNGNRMFEIQAEKSWKIFTHTATE
ncbi:shikimate dehydrogenase [Bacteroidales bacterium OttesenSCG-928-B11]|nr:shikimate dehydrogenase [Bacteroidales bacterium OttesenSCG-928-E04]MDL2311360.1 shikimate dehydrogenase [Bacteroidales bacterium OttesenSCG-928-B11]MDL2326026.1 shikimate dehydrogenase [Bacteroidales bacterium OttesenSCG-928-A14]